MPISRRVDKNAVVHIYNGILRAHKKEGNLTFSRAWMDLESIMLSEISQSGDNAQVTQELVLGEAHPSTGHHLCQVAPAHMGPKPQAAGIYHSHKGSSPCRAKKQRGASACVLFKTLSQNPTHWECPAFQPM